LEIDDTCLAGINFRFLFFIFLSLYFQSLWL
jgi:hypothetical protein